MLQSRDVNTNMYVYKTVLTVTIGDDAVNASFRLSLLFVSRKDRKAARQFEYTLNGEKLLLTLQ